MRHLTDAPEGEKDIRQIALNPLLLYLVSNHYSFINNRMTFVSL